MSSAKLSATADVVKKLSAEGKKTPKDTVQSLDPDLMSVVHSRFVDRLSAPVWIHRRTYRGKFMTQAAIKYSSIIKQLIFASWDLTRSTGT